MKQEDTKNKNNREGKKDFKLQGCHYMAIELRYSGNKYKEIANQLKEKFGRNYKEHKIRRWFQRGGVLEKEYNDYTKKENERRRNEVIDQMKSIIPLIPKKFKELLQNRNERMPFTGEVLKEKNEEGELKPIPKLDSITVNTLKALCEVLGFQITDGGGMEDPLDRYFDKAEKEMKKDGINKTSQ